MNTSVHISTNQYTWAHMSQNELCNKLMIIASVVHTSTHQCTWVQTSTREYTWVHISAHQYTSVHISTIQCTWVHMSPYLFCLTYLDLVVSHRFYIATWACTLRLATHSWFVRPVHGVRNQPGLDMVSIVLHMKDVQCWCHSITLNENVLIHK